VHGIDDFESLHLGFGHHSPPAIERGDAARILLLGFANAMTSEDSPSRPRKTPRQARSKQTVEWIVEGAARVFRAEGFGATTNRIADAAGVGIGTLYEYFPNKAALLLALAERHVQTAEHGIDAALAAGGTDRELLAALQAAILASQRYPSQALDLVASERAGAELAARASRLRERVLTVLTRRAADAGSPDPALRARAVFGVIAELTSRTLYEAHDPGTHARLARELLSMAAAYFAERADR
jgi:AcrR family transcriptional regulator